MVVEALGPMRVDGVVLSPRERVVLGVLLVRHGTAVSPGELADAVWGDDRPATWPKQLQASIAILRRALGARAIVTEAGGYRAALPTDELDTSRFAYLIDRARGLARDGDADRAVDGYRRAFELWRGTPYPDLMDWPDGAAEIDRLEQLRVIAEEEQLEQRLIVADARSVIPEAERQVRAAPLRESRWALLALANYRAGRQAEALATLRAARSRLIDEAGLEPGRLLGDLEASILRQDAELDHAPYTARASVAGCPWQGLGAYDIEDAAVFFGRDAEIERIVAMSDRLPFLVLCGPSGCGKSSLLLAGVLPRLIERGDVCVRVAPDDGLLSLRDAVERADVVVVDQLEELFQVPDADAYASAIADGLDRGRRVLATLRSDFLDDLASLPSLSASVSDGLFVVPPMSQSALRRAVEAPAPLAGLRLESGLVELLLRDAAGRYEVLPHLSHALVETWIRREGTALTVDGYQATGGIAGAIAQSAEDCYLALESEDQTRCRALLLRLVERTPDGAMVRRRLNLAALGNDTDRLRVLHALVAARLVTVDGDDAWISHEAVATAWPRLNTWLEEDVDGARLLRQLEAAAAEWDDGGRGVDDLWRGARLQSALAWRAASDPDLTPAEAGFVDASAANEEAQLGEVVRRAARDRTQNRRLRWSLAGAAALLVVALVAAGVATVRGSEAAAAAEDAQIEALTATSLALRGSDRDVAALLAAEAYRRWPDDARVRSALMGTVTAAEGLVEKHDEGWPLMMEVIPGTQRVLTIFNDADPSVTVFDHAEDRLVREIDLGLPSARTEFSRMISFNADGRIGSIQTSGLPKPDDLATCCTNHLTFFELDTGAVLGGSQMFDLRMGEPVALSETGDTAFVRHSVIGSVFAINTHNGEVRSSDAAAFGDFTGQSAEFNSLALVAGTGIVAGFETGIVIYDPVSLQETQRIDITPGTARSQVMSDRRGGVIASGEAGLVRVDLETGTQKWFAPVRPGHECRQLEVAPDGERFYCSAEGEVVEHFVDTGERTGRFLTTQLDIVAEIGMVDGGRDLIVSDYQSPVWMKWRLDGSGAAVDLRAAGMTLGGGVGGHGRYVIALDEPGQMMQLWDIISDVAIGEPAERLTWLGDEVMERWSNDTGTQLENITTGERYPLDRDGELADLPEDSWLTDGGDGPRAFAVAEDSLIPFNPLTGEQSGPALVIGEPELYEFALTIHETQDASRVVVTWWDVETEQTVTTVFDGVTGEIVAQGLYGVDGTVLLPSGDIVGASNDRLVVVDGSTLVQLQVLSKPAGGSRGMNVSADGSTLLNEGWDNRVTIYDLDGSLKIGDTLDDATDLDARGTYLSDRGNVMLRNSPEGILVWDLDPSAHFSAACRIAGRELSADEWRTYLGDSEPQVATCAGML